MADSSPIDAEAKEAAAVDALVAASELTPEQKKAEAQKAAPVDPSLSRLKPTKHLSTDIGTANTDSVVAAIAVADSKPVAPTTTAQPTATPAKPEGPPGSFRAGWTAFSQLPNPGDTEALDALAAHFSPERLAELYSGSRNSEVGSQLSSDLLAQHLSEAYYGQWYHNAAALLFTIVITWLVTRLGGGLIACLVIGAFVATYYQTSMRRLRRNARDDIQRELMSNRLDTDIETAGWINHFLSRFWLIYEPVLSAQIIGTADAILMDNTPSFLDSIRLSTFTLGTKAPVVEGIKTYPKTDPKVVCMDWTVSFIPNDTLDLTQRDIQAKVNPKIVLTIRVGKGMLGAGVPILLEDLAFKATMRIKFRMSNEFPHVKSIEASFLEKPMFDYVLKPLGGETFGFDINNIPGLQTFVQEQVHATLGPMMYAPNVYTVDVAGMMAGTTDLDSANGVLAVTIFSAANLKTADLFGSLDPYITVHIANIHNAEQARTATHEDNANPKFDETHFILLNNLNDSIYFQVMDRNSGRKDTAVGVASMDLKTLSESDNAMDAITLSVLRNGKPVGEIRCAMRYFPVSKPNKLEDGTIEPPEESNSGVLRFTVHECKSLGGEGAKKSGPSLPIFGNKEDTSAYAVVKVNGKDKLKTKPFKRSVNPRWDKWVEVFVADKSKLQLGVNVMNSNEFSDDTVLGRWRSSLTEMQDQINAGIDWWNLQDGQGKIHLSATWKPVVMTGFAESLGHGHYRPPIGVMRVKLNRAEDLKNVEALTGGKSDPYVRILSGMQVRGQTERIDDNLNPVWDQALYVPLHSIRENLTLEVMDYNDIQKDKSLGLYELVVKDLIRETVVDGQSVYEGTEPITTWVDLMSSDRKKGKGRLHFEASFHPTLELPQPKKKENETTAPEKNASTTNLSATDAKAPEDKPENKPEDEPENKEEEGPQPLPEKDVHGYVIHYTTEARDTVDLMKYQSGILAVTIHQAKFNERIKAFADILVDSNDPQYRTLEVNGVDLPFNETGDAFVKELDFARVVVRVRTAKDNDKDDSYVGIWSGNVQDILRKLQGCTPEEKEQGVEYELKESGGGSIRLSFKYTPVINFTLDPSESLENQGNLTVTAISANNLKAVDRAGTSDPYVVFVLDGEKVYKTEPVRKQLNPVFNKESFTIPVPKRIGAKLVAMVYDWDQIGKDELLGQGEIPFDGDTLESFTARQMDIPLGGGATLRVNVLWQPQLLARKRTNTTLFGATTRIFTAAPGAALGAGIGAGTKVFGTGTKVLGGGVSAIGRGIKGIGGTRRKKSSDSSQDSTLSVTPAPTVSTQRTDTQPQQRRSSAESVARSMTDGQSVQSTNGGAAREATVSVTLVGARRLTAMDKGGTSDPYARVRVGNKVVHKTRNIKKTLQPEWNESFTTKLRSNGQLDIKVKDKNTLSDVDIGGCILNVWDVLQGDQTTYDGWLPLEPNAGEIHVRIKLMRDAEISSTSRGLFGKK